VLGSAGHLHTDHSEILVGRVLLTFGGFLHLLISEALALVVCAEPAILSVDSRIFQVQSVHDTLDQVGRLFFVFGVKGPLAQMLVELLVAGLV